MRSNFHAFSGWRTSQGLMLEWGNNSVQMCELFRDRNPHFFGKNSCSWLIIEVFWIPIGSMFYDQITQDKNFGQNLNFCGSYFLFHLWNWVSWTNIETNAAIWSPCGHKFLGFFNMCAFVGEKFKIVWIITFLLCIFF